MSNLHRKDGGQPIRDAMKAAGLSGPALAEATRRVDPDGRGVSAAIIGRLAGTGLSERERCRLRTAWLIAVALQAPLQNLFELFSAPRAVTVTEERSTSDGQH